MLRVHLTLHDVSPAFTPAIESALDLCARFDAKPALLVVPNHHGAFPLGDHAAFCQRLRELGRAGHEIYLHGLLHQARPAAASVDTDGRPRGLGRLFAQHVVSAGEAEFSDVGRREAEERLDEGLRVLRAAGLEPQGFVPPAWSMPAWVRPLLAARGIRYTEDHLRVYDPVERMSRPTLLVNWATRSRPRLWSTVIAGRLLWLASNRLPLRLALHPHDLGHPVVRSEIVTLLGRAHGHFVERGTDLLARSCQ